MPVLEYAATDLAFEPDGSFVFASRDGLGHFAIATGKVTITAAEIQGPIAVAGELVFGMRLREPVLVDRAGKVQTRFAAIDPALGTIDQATASPDGRWIAIVCAEHLVILDVVNGTHVGAPIVSTGVMFSPSNELMYVDRDKLVSANHRAKPAKAAARNDDPMVGVLERRGPWLLDRFGRIAHDHIKQHRGLWWPDRPWHQAFAWGAEPDQVVCADRMGIEIMTTSGTLVRTIARPHRTDVRFGKTVAGWFVCTTESAIERHDLTSTDLRPVPRSRVEWRPSVRYDHPKGKQLLAAYWKHPGDESALRVWADLLTEQGDRRGELILLSLLEVMTDEQAARQTLLEDERGEMAGPARDYLEAWRFADGLIASARCEAMELIAGFDHIRWLHPRLRLTVTKLNKPLVAALAHLELGAIYGLRFDGNVIDDAIFAKLAPALAGVKELTLESSRLTKAAVPMMAALTGIVELVLSKELGTQRAVRTRIRALLPSLANLNSVSLRRGKRPS